VSATCAFPFAGDELYGQHAHPAAGQPVSSAPYAPAFFSAEEYTTLSRVADVIIPPGDTPGAAAAGVPEYIDRVVSANAEHRSLMRAGLEWLDRQARDRFGTPFAALGEPQQLSLLQPLSDRIDREARELQARRFRSEAGGSRVYYVPLTEKAPPARPVPAKGVNSPDDPTLPPRFFRLVKNLTADGYYTSRVGLLEELEYRGNTFLARFPSCEVKEQ
jgi:hypothetical protein